MRAADAGRSAARGPLYVHVQVKNSLIFPLGHQCTCARVARRSGFSLDQLMGPVEELTESQYLSARHCRKYLADHYSLRSVWIYVGFPDG